MMKILKNTFAFLPPGTTADPSSAAVANVAFPSDPYICFFPLNLSTLPFHRASSPSHSPAPATSRDILFHASHSNNTDSRTSHIDSKASIMLMAVSLNDSATRAARGASGYDQAYYRGPRRETADDGRVCWWELRNGATQLCRVDECLLGAGALLSPVNSLARLRYFAYILNCHLLNDEYGSPSSGP